MLNNAVLNLKRGKRYGLCGPNGCGKSTLMRSIANGQVKEFPPQDVLKTVYVEHDIDAEETQQSVINYVSSDSQLKGKRFRVEPSSLMCHSSGNIKLHSLLLRLCKTEASDKMCQKVQKVLVPAEITS